MRAAKEAKKQARQSRKAWQEKQRAAKQDLKREKEAAKQIAADTPPEQQGASRLAGSSEARAVYPAYGMAWAVVFQCADGPNALGGRYSTEHEAKAAASKVKRVKLGASSKAVGGYFVVRVSGDSRWAVMYDLGGGKECLGNGRCPTPEEANAMASATRVTTIAGVPHNVCGYKLIDGDAGPWKLTAFCEDGSEHTLCGRYESKELATRIATTLRTVASSSGSERVVRRARVFREGAPGERASQRWLNQVAIALTHLGFTERARNTGRVLGGVPVLDDITFDCNAFSLVIGAFETDEMAADAELALNAKPELSDALSRGRYALRSDDRLLYTASGHERVVDEFLLEDVVLCVGEIDRPPIDEPDWIDVTMLGENRLWANDEAGHESWSGSVSSETGTPLRESDGLATSATPGRVPLEFPPISIPDDLRFEQRFSAAVRLARKPAALSGLEESYYGALAELESGDSRAALVALRSVIVADDRSQLPSAKVLAALLSLQLGNVATPTALFTACRVYEPDPFANCVIEDCALQIPPLLRLSNTLCNPCLALGLATVGADLSVGRLAEAANGLEEMKRLADGAPRARSRGAHPAELTVPVGRDPDGRLVLCCLGKTGHLLIRTPGRPPGTQAIDRIASWVLRRLTPDELAFVLVDLEGTGLARYEGLPHNLGRVVHDVHGARACLRWLVEELDARSALLAHHGCQNLSSYNVEAPEGRVPMCLCVVHGAGATLRGPNSEATDLIRRLLHEGPRSGIHLVLTIATPGGQATGDLLEDFGACVTITQSDADGRRYQGQYEEGATPVAVTLEPVARRELDELCLHWRSQDGDEPPGHWRLPGSRPDGIDDLLLAIHAALGQQDFTSLPIT